MGKNGQITIRETVHAPRRVAWLVIGRTYQIRTSNTSFAKARVLSKGEGAVSVEFFGAPRNKQLQRPNTPLFRALQPVRQIERLPIRSILTAQEVI